MKASHQSVLDHLSRIGEIRSLLENADYVGLKIIDASQTLESFLISMFSYRPQLIRWLYRLRAPLVRLLGFKQDAMPEMDEWLPDYFPMFPCESVWFFTVRYVQEGHYWIAGCPRDRHLDADLAVVAEPLADEKRRFYVLTVVRYKHWTGPVYFNMIRLFNLLLVNRMTRFAAGRDRLRNVAR
jgi:hypothetical protein